MEKMDDCILYEGYSTADDSVRGSEGLQGSSGQASSDLLSSEYSAE
uniref:Uncharacterized protein n=1 Tax=Arundo donax TaxID=35708 RepID=A0A0A8XR56_ARUDO